MINSSETEASSISIAHQAIFMVVWVFATIINLLTIIIMGRSVYVRKTWPNILVFFLSFTDLFIIIVGFFPAVLVLFMDHLLLYKNTSLCNFQGIVLNASYLVSFYLVASISVDRYFAICHPFLYNKNVSQTQSLRVKYCGLLVVTTLSIFVSLIPFMAQSNHVVHYPGTYCLFDWSSFNVASRLIIIINMLGYSASMMVIIFSTIKICHAAIKMRRAKIAMQVSSHKRINITGNDLELNFAKLAVVVSTVFFLCSLPFEVTSYLYVLLEFFSTFTDLSDTGADRTTFEPKCGLRCYWHTDA